MHKALARSCFRRDNWKCRHCGNCTGLHPHHVKYKSAGGADALDNLLTLCAKCHRDVHDRYLKIEADADGYKFRKQKGWRA